MKKALMVLFIFICSGFISADAVAQTLIFSEPRSNILQMQEWARTRNANQTFIDLAPIFYEASILKGVDPAVTYTQSAKETNFGNFGNVLDDSFFNPCGLKTTAGGDNNDPNAHHRFSSWEEGIIAQVDHLSIYAGVPIPNSPDPRHFAFITGTAPTVESLGGRWAPSPTYGNEIVSLMNELFNTDIQPVHILDDSTIVITSPITTNENILVLPKNVLVPIRDICLALDIQVFWDGERRQVQIPSHDLILTIGDKRYTANEFHGILPYAPILVNNRAMIPLTAFANILGKVFVAEMTLDAEMPTDLPYPIIWNYTELRLIEVTPQ